MTTTLTENVSDTWMVGGYTLKSPSSHCVLHKKLMVSEFIAYQETH